VFPGGRVEDVDRSGEGRDPAVALERSARRETREEAGLELGGESLLHISRWITPEIAPRRFDTWFYATRVHVGRVSVDGREICTHRWLAPEAAIRASRGGEMRLAPPTFVTLDWLVPHRTAADALLRLARGPILTFQPRICSLERGTCMLYPGDAGYEARDPDRPGARHRLWALPDGMRYERTELAIHS
jgi:8-oxo-dGTP pyrophosphatase MutT (NUDIX family)